MTSLLQLTNISVNRKNHQILNNVSLDIPANKIFGLLGNNGAGKTTLLKTILLMNKKFDGRIVYQGNLLTRLDIKEFGALIESPALYPHLTAHDNLEIMVKLYNLPESTINDTLKKVGLDNIDTKKPVKKFSLGMKQRLGIGMAIIHKPALLILDEPTNGLDINGVEDFKNILSALRDDGMTIMITTHQITDLASLFDSFAILKDGQICFTSPDGITSPTELKSIYQHYTN